MIESSCVEEAEIIHLLFKSFQLFLPFVTLSVFIAVNKYPVSYYCVTAGGDSLIVAEGHQLKVSLM